MNIILNIAAGKELPLELPEPYFLINSDIMYYQNTQPDVIEKELAEWNGTLNKSYYCKTDIYEFMERTKISFDKICIYRFLEHVLMDKVCYFIYLLSTITNKGSLIDVIVPNYTMLAEMILNEKIDNNFDANNIILTTELLNQPPDPHTSVWTMERAKYFFELEKRFKITSIDQSFEFDGRNIYLRFQAERI